MIAAAALAAALIASPIPMPTAAQPTHTAQAGCHNKLARMLWRAGFTGDKNRVAWSIVMRESNGQNLQPGFQSFNGHDWGIWQVNQPTWGNAPWWTIDAMTTPARQSRIVYRYLTRHGTDWRSWGLNSTGTAMDTTWYSMWSDSQQNAWIWNPYAMWRGQYPQACAS